MRVGVVAQKLFLKSSTVKWGRLAWVDRHHEAPEGDPCITPPQIGLPCDFRGLFFFFSAISATLDYDFALVYNEQSPPELQ
jgi:hypothetical protein